MSALCILIKKYNIKFRYRKEVILLLQYLIESDHLIVKEEVCCMRISLKFQTEGNTLPIDYNKYFVSFIKKALCEYNPEYYEQLYRNDDPIVKSYTGAVYFDHPKFEPPIITFDNHFIQLNISCYKLEEGIMLYNAFMLQKNKKFLVKENALLLTEVNSWIDDPIVETNVVVKTLSPIIARYHDIKTKQDRYYTFLDPEFSDIIKMNVENVIQKLNLDISTDDFEIIPLKCHKTIVKSYNCSMDASLGIFQLKGNPELVNFLVQAGLGSKRSSIYGNIKIIG